jgi:uncharacterized protein (TIGR02284 family)
MQELIMAEQTERDVLNRLIQTCRDGELGFRYAANHVRTPDVKALFLELANQRDALAGEILPHAQRLGGAAERDGSVAGALHRGWMTIKDTIGAHEDAVIIREAERGERIALAAYEDALDGMLPPSARDLVERHCSHIRQSFNRVHAMLTV